MSLEQALIDATAAIKQLTVVLATASEATPKVEAAPAPKVEAKRTKKVEAPVEAPAAGYLNEGDPEGTRYFHIPSHNTVYKQLPGDPDCTIQGALIVSGAEYLKQAAEIAKKFPSASAAETPAPATSAPTATAPVADVSAGPSFEDVVAKMRELHKAQQQEGMLKVLNKYGATRVPELNGKAPNDVLIADIEAVLMGL